MGSGVPPGVMLWGFGGDAGNFLQLGNSSQRIKMIELLMVSNMKPAALCFSVFFPTNIRCLT